MYLCLKCGKETTLPICQSCGFEFQKINGIYQMTDLPNINLDQPNKYIGYDEIGLDFEPGQILYEDWSTRYGVYESCSEKLIEHFGKDIVVLDLGAGLGSASIPLAKSGAQVIAVDISQKMLSILVERLNNDIPTNLTCCRLNAYDLKLANQSIDVIVENAMLHLVDHPQLIIEEMKRVLKPKGAIVRYGSPSLQGDAHRYEVNSLCNEVLRDISGYYYQEIKKYGYEELWFDQPYNELILESFEKPYNVITDLCEEFTDKMKFRIHRLKTKAHSGLQHIPNKIHEKAWNETEKYAIKKYGEQYIDLPSYSKYTSCIDIYIKKM